MNAARLAAALTLAAIPLTTTALAFADEPLGPPAPEASAAPVAPPVSTGTPLQMKPTKEAQPLVLAHDAPISWSTKAMLMIGVAGVGYLVWKKKRISRPRR